MTKMVRNGSERRRQSRMLAMVGTALGTTLLVPAASQAQNVTYNGPGPYTLTQTTPVSGGPRAIDVTVTSGDATVDTSATTVTTTNNGNTAGTAIGVNNTGPGAVTVRNGDVTATGSGQINALDLRATTGTITVNNTGTISASGNNGDRAISALSGGGDVTITSNVANGQLRGIAVGGNGGTFGTTGTTTINSTTATANGTGTINAILAQGNRVVVNSGSASNTNAGGNQGTAIFVNANTGGALVTAGTTSAFGQNQAAIQIFSAGTVDVTSGTIRTTQNSDGLSIASGTSVVARSTAITLENGGRGIVLGGNAGGGGFNSGPNGFAYTSAAVTSGTITTAGNGAYGIYATPNGNGTTTLNSDTIRTSGAGATGVFVTAIGTGAITGATTINSTGQINTTGANAAGILVNGGTGAVTVNNSGLVSATGAGSAGIALQGGTGARTIVSDRITTGAGTGIDVTTDGAVDIRSTSITRNAAGTGINVAPTNDGPTSVTIASGTITGGNFGISTGGVRGDTSITSGTIALTSTASANTNSLTGIGISAIGAGAVTVNSGSLTFTGSGNTVGITAQATGTGSGAGLTINSRDVSVIGNGGYAILGSSQTAAIAITSTGAVTTTGTTRQAGGQAGVAFSRYADGILAYSQAGAIGIVNSGTITTSGATARGISVESGRAIESFSTPATAESTAAITIANSGAIRTAGTNAAGITIRSDSNPVTVTSNDIATRGATATGINVAQFGTGATTITSGAITTAGAGANGIQVGAIGTGTLSGATVINSTGALQTTGAGAHGIRYLGGTGTLAINNTGTITTGGNSALGMFLSNTNGATVATNAIVTTGTGVASGIQVNARAGATGPFSITSGSIAIQNAAANGTGISLSSGVASPVTIVSETITNAGTGGGISVSNGPGATGNVSITSRDITLSGAETTAGFRPAIGTFQTAGTTVINSTGTIQSSGHGIVLQGRDGQPSGPVSITSNVINAVQSAISATGSAATSITAATTTVTGDNQLAILVAPSGGGTVNVQAGTITTTGANALGVYVAGGTTGGAATVAVGTATTTGSAIDARTQGNQSLTLGTGRVAGSGATGITAISSAGSVTVNSTDLAVTGGRGIFAQGPTAATVNSGTLAVTGTGVDYALLAQNNQNPSQDTGPGTVSVTSTSLSTQTGGISAFGSRATITVDSGTIATNGQNAATGIALYAVGESVLVNSGTITNTGAGNRIGIAAQTLQSGTVGQTNPGTLTINSGSVTTVGDGAYAIQGITDAGLLTINSTGAIVTSGTTRQAGTQPRYSAGIIAVSGSGAIAVTSNNVTTSGAQSDGIRVEAGSGVASYNVSVNAAPAPISVTTTGLTQTSGAQASGINILGGGGAVTVTNTGTIAATGAGGRGVNVTGTGATTITNRGTISASGGAAILAAGPTTIDNSGTIAGAGGIAVQLGAADDRVTLRTGSAITGRIVGGGGSDAATLVGTIGTPTTTQTVAGFDGFDRLTVQSGYWTAAPTNASAFNGATIAAGATLEVANGATGLAGIATPSIVDNGTLVVRSSAASAGNTFGATTVTGTGGILFTGAGTTTLAGANSLQNTGVNTIDSGTVLVTGTQGGTFVTTANGTLQLGDGGTGGTFTGNLANSGTLVVNRSDDSSFAGALTGAGLFVKQGAGRITFGSGYAFTGTTQLNGGTIRLSTPVAATTELDLRGNGTVDLSGQSNTVAELAGNSAAASLNIAGGSLTVNQATNTSFAGSIVGAGSLTKTGPGTLNLTGTSSYAGPTAVNGGRLAVNGSIVSPVFVNTGGTLGGTGTVGGTTVASGGTWAPGNSIGTQTVNGNVAFAAGSTYQVEVNAAGAADRINATGTATLSGGTVQVLAENGSYARRTDYTILTAAGGVNGRFAAVTSNLAFLSPSLGYGLNAVTLSLTRNDVSFASVAATDNQRGVAGAIFARGVNDPLFTSILFSSEDGARAAFTTLGGELNAGLNTELADNGTRVRQAVLDRGAIDNTIGGDGLGLWVQGLQSIGLSDAATDRARLRANRTGVIGGIDYVAGALRIGGFGGYQDDRVTLRSRASSAEIDTVFAGANVAWHSGALLIQAGGLYAWHDVDTTRALSGVGLGTATASPDANSAQLFAEAGYALTTGSVLVTPFVRNAYTWSRVKAFEEAGGTGALTVERDRREIGLASAGIRVDGSAPLGSLTVVPRMSIAYQRGYGDLQGVAVQRFGGTGPAFVTTGASLGKDGLAVDGGFDLQTGRFGIGVGGFASTSNRWGDYGGKVALSIRF